MSAARCWMSMAAACSAPDTDRSAPLRIHHDCTLRLNYSTKRCIVGLDPVRGLQCPSTNHLLPTPSPVCLSCSLVCCWPSSPVPTHTSFATTTSANWSSTRWPPMLPIPDHSTARRIGHVPAAVAAHAHVRLFGVAGETFEHAQPRAIGADHRRGLVGQHLLIRHRLHEFADPQAAGVARGESRRQRVVGADHLVAVGDVGARPEEQRAVVLHVLEEIVRIARHHLHVLGGEAVGLGHHLLLAVAHDDGAVVGPGFAPRSPASAGSAAAAPPRPSSRARVSLSWSTGSPASSARVRPGPSRSVAHSSPSTLSSAMTNVSVGPASRSMPTRPNSCRLASAT